MRTPEVLGVAAGDSDGRGEGLGVPGTEAGVGVRKTHLTRKCQREAENVVLYFSPISILYLLTF